MQLFLLGLILGIATGIVLVATAIVKFHKNN